jgi:hypothetical protein
MKRILLFAAIASVAVADTNPSPSGNRTTPPTINSVSPRGVARGTTVEMTVEGLNLAKARNIIFDTPGVKGRIVRVKELPDLPDIRLGSNGGISTIDLGPLPPRNQVTLEIEISPEAVIGPVNFRLQNDLGTSPEGRFLIEPYYGESPDKEPNNTPEQAFETYLPTILVGEVSRPGDVDYYKIKVKAGEQLVFENGGMMIGSSLQPVVALLREDQSVAAEFGKDGGLDTTWFAHKFDTAGTYYVRVSDYQGSGRTGHTYRIKVGDFPVVTKAFPLGVQKGKTAELKLTGYGLGTPKVQLKGDPTDGMEDTARFRANTDDGPTFNELRLDIGTDPEVLSTGNNTSITAAQTVTAPATINGIVANKAEQFFRVHAAKGQKLVFEVKARRLGSQLDSFIEVLDAKGNPIEIATVRPINETNVVLRDHDSSGRGIRIASWSTTNVGDYLMAGSEIMRVDALPLGPDEDVVMEAFGGQRIAYFATSPEAHALDQPVYKVQIYPPGKQFTPNGLPLTRLYARNDDGGPGFGKDSMLTFTAPADGDYIVRLRDVRGLGGDDYAYRLNVRQPRPDFRLAVSPRNPNVPVGGSVPVTVSALRLDGFDGKIDVTVEGLPKGLHATTATVMPGQDQTTLLISADADASVAEASELKVVGRNGTIAHYANPDDKLKLVALMPKADVLMQAQTKEIVLEPGGSAEVSVKIERQNGFGGRVPVEVRNLPPRVHVLDVGLNGVLINEDQTERSFTVEALPNAEPGEQLIYVAAKVETRSPLSSSYAAGQPILLKVKPKAERASR